MFHSNLEKLIEENLYKPKPTTVLKDMELAEAESYEDLALACKHYRQLNIPVQSIQWLVTNMVNLDFYKSSKILERSREEFGERNKSKVKTKSRESNFKSMFE